MMQMRSRAAPVTMSLLAGLAMLYALSCIPGGLNLASLINGPGVPELVQVGGNARDLTFGNLEVWRLLTATLLHGGFVHILMNGLALWNLGGQLEEIVGGEEVLLAFVVTGIAGSLASAGLGNPQIISIGASGAICGLFGFICAVGTRNVQQLLEQLRRNVMNIVLLLGLGFIIPNVDNWAHIGGILSGLALGFFYRPQSRDRRRVLGGLSAVVLVYGAYRIAANVFPGLG